MNPIVNHLIQLQELVLIRDEQKAHGHRDRLEQLEGAIDGLSGQLPVDVRRMFSSLQARNRLAVVPVSNGVCVACGMKLPISFVQTVRTSPRVQHCPNCTRMLYYPESPIRQSSRPTRRADMQKAGISRFSSHSLVIPRLAAKDRDGAIRELAERVVAEGFVDSADWLVDRALAREAVCSTAVDHGLAFPHVRGVEGGGLTLALGVSPKGIRFDDSAKGLTRIVFFEVIPMAASAFHLKLVAGLAETFRDADARKALIDESDPEKLWKVLTKATRRTIP